VDGLKQSLKNEFNLSIGLKWDFQVQIKLRFKLKF